MYDDVIPLHTAMGTTTCTPPSCASTLYSTVGASLAITCSTSYNYQSTPLLDIQWIGPNGSVSSSGRISTTNVSSYVSIAPAYIYMRSLTFSTLSSQDNNTVYQCRIGTLYTPYFTQYSTANTTVIVNGKFSVLCGILTHLCFPLSLST